MAPLSGGAMLFFGWRDRRTRGDCGHGRRAAL